MPNPIKYNTSTETLALKKGNFWIGTGDVGKGPTSSTGFYNGITPPTGGYTIYLNKETSGPSIYTVSTEAQLVSLTNTIGAQSFTTSGQCLNWFATQTDKMVFNIDYPAIVTDGLVLNLDAGFTPSYPKNGTTWYDMSLSGNNGILTNGPTFDSGDGGSIVFDGVDDYSTQNYNLVGSTDFSIEIWARNDYQRHPTITNNNLALGGVVAQGGSYLRFGVYPLTNNSPGYVLFWANGPNTFVGPNLPAGLNINAWHCYTFTRTTTFQRIYVDGNLLAESTFNNTTPININYNGIGRYAYTYWDGAFSSYRIYNRALSATEVLQNYNAQKGRFGL